MRRTAKSRKKAPEAARRPDAMLSEARALGYFDDKRTVEVSSSVPAGLLKAAKRNVDVKSNSELVIVALSRLALEDQFGKWLLQHKGTVDPSIDLEF
jgi:hypothetical protein